MKHPWDDAVCPRCGKTRKELRGDGPTPSDVCVPKKEAKNGR